METSRNKSEILFELAAILGQQNDFEEILRLVSSKTCFLFDAEAVSIMMINPRTQNTVKTIVKEGSQTAQKRYRLVHANVTGWVSKKKESFLSPDVKKDSRFRKDVFGDDAVQSVMCVPLHSEGLTAGYLLALNKIGNSRFSENDLLLFEKMAAITAPFLSNAQKIQEYFNPPMPEIALVSKYESTGLLGKSRQFIELLRAIEAAARCDVRVLLEGQSGTGKELIARAIHKFSARKQHPFVAIDCGSIPENLIESELFGHVKGAFTGATHDRLGLIEKTHLGTLFLDEVGNLPYEMQAKLLRVLQEGEVRPVGSNNPVKVDVRVIAACSASLRTLVAQQAFRQDLYYRLHVYPIQIPTLNERRDDIPLLANHFLLIFSQQQQKKAQSFHGSLLRFLRRRNWSGNIRELENFVERLVTISKSETATLNKEMLPADLMDEYREFSDAQKVGDGKSLKQQLQESEHRIIRKTLAENNWNQSKTALALQTSEQLIRYRMKKLGISRPKRISY